MLVIHQLAQKNGLQVIFLRKFLILKIWVKTKYKIYKIYEILELYIAILNPIILIDMCSENIGKFFEVNKESIVVNALSTLSREQKIASKIVNDAIKQFRIDPEKPYPTKL